MKPRAVWTVVPVLVIGGAIALLVWRTRRARRAEAGILASLPRTVEIGSDAFEDNGLMPRETSCEGQGFSPPLHWSNLPEDTRSLVLVVTDVDIPSPRIQLFQIVHWVLYDISPEVTALVPGVSDDELARRGIVVGRNWSRQRRYLPPCPVSGTHRYVFRLYALDLDTLQPHAPNRRGVLKAMEGHVLAYGELSGLCEKQQ